MTDIVSGTTTERLVRSSALTLLVCAFSALSFYDGYISYPKHNIEVFVSKMNIQVDEPPSFNPELTPARAAELKASYESGAAPSIEEATTEIGVEPVEHDGVLLFFGAGGCIEATVRFDRIVAVNWRDAAKTHSDLIVQKVMGYSLGVLGLFLILRLFGIVTARTVLTNDGLKMRGTPLVPFSAMSSIDASRYKKKGYLDIICEIDGKQTYLRLDDYVIKEFRPIVETIVERTGLPNPLPPKPKDKADGDENVTSDPASE